MTADDRPDWIDETAYPFRSFFVDVGPGRMHYVDVGPGRRNYLDGGDEEGPDASATLLMLHGNPTWSFMYRGVIEQLSGTSRCIAPDWLGFGLSDKPVDWTYKPAGYADCLHRFAESLELHSVILVVHDWGGPIGLRLAIDRPKLVESLVILNSWMWPLDDVRFRALGRLAASSPGRYAIRRLNALTKLMPLAFGDSSRLTPDAHLHYQRALERAPHASSSLPGEFAGSREWLDALWNRRDDLSDVTKLFIWGHRDPALGPPILERWLETFPASEAVMLPDVGHFVPEEAPDRVASAIQQHLLHSD